MKKAVFSFRSCFDATVLADSKAKACIVTDRLALSDFVFTRGLLCCIGRYPRDRPSDVISGSHVNRLIDELIMQTYLAFLVGVAIDDLFAGA
ncbi:hypothetical protein, partial [Herbaspirillum sp. UBA812]|uniref:hypothetical protein n=1 Tax=Herbaspirillum sp. UBA812 TaxID=1946590 RepID=UPI002580F096